jgi:hypothetical protein
MGFWTLTQAHQFLLESEAKQPGKPQIAIRRMYSV